MPSSLPTPPSRFPWLPRRSPSRQTPWPWTGRTGRAFVTTLSTTSGAHGAVYVFDAATGHTLNTVDIGDTAGASPAIAVDEPHTRVLVSNPTQTAIYVLDAQAGTVLRTLTLGQGIAFLAVDVSSGMLYAADLNDNSLKICHSD